MRGDSPPPSLSTVAGATRPRPAPGLKKGGTAMTSTALVRWGTVAATAAGVAWCGLSLLSLATPEPARYLDALFVVPFALSLGGVVGLHAAQRARTGRLERVGFGVSALGMIATLAGQIGIVADLDPLKRLVLPVGLAAWVGGFLLLGI